MDRLLAEAGVGDAPLVVLQPGAGSPLKTWQAERLAAVGAALANDLGARVVVSGTAAERVLAQQVCNALPSGAINLAGALQWTELEALLARGSALVDAALAEPELTRESAADASLTVAAAKALAQEFAVEIASGVLELAGASATDRKYALDRHWRNVRVHSLHDPARWKYVHLGNHTLRATLPPRLGVLL